ncbi:MAG: flagellar hook capping FlgD N-terminal domain-containing protein [Thermodesulfobacteriota bacterium]
MNISNAATTTAASSSSGTSRKQVLGQQDFLKLFIAQIQYQDPLKPMDTYEMAAQMANFTNIESLQSIDRTLKDLKTYQTSQNNLQLLSLLDATVQAEGSLLAVYQGEVQPTEIILEEGTDSCVVEIRDAAGGMVRSLDLGPLPAGRHQLAWDGKDGAGRELPDGPYTYQVQARDGVGLPVAAQASITGRVTGLEFAEDGARLTVDGAIPLAASEIIKVM